MLNKVLTILSVKWITWIGYDTHSRTMTNITNGVFIAQFFNTALLILLVNANLEETIPPAGTIFNGPFNDYMPIWYSAVGYTIVQTMIINAFMPVISQVISDVLKAWGQRRDQSWEKDPAKAKYVTKKTQVSQYMDLYMGPEYIVHFKYSSVFNITFVTMMYGVGIPILFPIAVLSYTILWISERYYVAYNFQMPPSLDDRLSKNAVNVLKYAPMIFLFNGFWMLSNK